MAGWRTAKELRRSEPKITSRTGRIRKQRRGRQRPARKRKARGTLRRRGRRPIPGPRRRASRAVASHGTMPPPRWASGAAARRGLPRARHRPASQTTSTLTGSTNRTTASLICRILACASVAACATRSRMRRRTRGAWRRATPAASLVIQCTAPALMTARGSRTWRPSRQRRRLTSPRRSNLTSPTSGRGSCQTSRRSSSRRSSRQGSSSRAGCPIARGAREAPSAPSSRAAPTRVSMSAPRASCKAGARTSTGSTSRRNARLRACTPRCSSRRPTTHSGTQGRWPRSSRRPRSSRATSTRRPASRCGCEASRRASRT